jgi:hemerythrin-like metal-binding protein
MDKLLGITAATVSGDLTGGQLPPLVWLSVFETGDATVDREHHELLDDVNNLSRSLAEGKDWQLVVSLSKQLCDEAFAHFRDERAVLERVKYGKLAAHEREHRHIEKELKKILATIDGVARPSRAEVEAVFYLRSLLVHHFFRFDIAYKAHLSGAPSKGSRSRRTEGKSVEP